MSPTVIGLVETLSPSGKLGEPLINPVIELSLFFFQFTNLGTPGGIFLASIFFVEKILVVRLNGAMGFDFEGGDAFCCFEGVFVGLDTLLRLNSPPPPDFVFGSR